MNKITRLAGAIAVVALAQSAHALGAGAQGQEPSLINFLCLGLGATAFVVWGRAVFPQAANAADRVVARNSNWRLFWIGLANAVAAALLIVTMIKGAEAGLRFLPPLVMLSLAGLGVLVFRGALGLWPSYGYLILGKDAAVGETHATLVGGALLSGLVLLFPIGLLFVAYTFVRALGVSVLLIVKDKEVVSP